MSGEKRLLRLKNKLMLSKTTDFLANYGMPMSQCIGHGYKKCKTFETRFGNRVCTQMNSEYIGVGLVDMLIWILVCLGTLTQFAYDKNITMS